MRRRYEIKVITQYYSLLWMSVHTTQPYNLCPSNMITMETIYLIDALRTADVGKQIQSLTYFHQTLVQQMSIFKGNIVFRQHSILCIITYYIILFLIGCCVWNERWKKDCIFIRILYHAMYDIYECQFNVWRSTNRKRKYLILGIFN